MGNRFASMIAGRWSSWVLVLAGVAMAGLGIRESTRRDASPVVAPAVGRADLLRFELVDPPQTIGSLVGVPLTIRITNRDETRAFTLLGAESRCVPGGCVAWQGVPRRVEPGRSITVPAEIQANRAGPVELALPVFTDAPGQAVVEVVWRGEVIDAGLP